MREEIEKALREAWDRALERMRESLEKGKEVNERFLDKVIDK